MLRRLMSSLKSRFASAPERDEEPLLDANELIDDALMRDQQLRNEAARLIADKTVLFGRIRKAATEIGVARGMARRALLEAIDARRLGDEEAVSRRTDDVRAHAARMHAGQEHLDDLRSRYREAAALAEEARQAMEENAMRVRGIADRRPGMAEVVQRTVSAVSTTIEDATPTPTALNEEIELVATGAETDAAPSRSRIDQQQGRETTDIDDELAAFKAELGL